MLIRGTREHITLYRLFVNKTKYQKPKLYVVRVQNLGIFRSPDMNRPHHQNQTNNVQPPILAENISRRNSPSGVDLWGATTRSVVSSVQIFYGIIEIAVITTFIALSIKNGVFMGLFGIIAIVLGILSAVVFIIAGGIGRCSRQNGCKVIAYMVLNVSSALCGAFCLVFIGFTLVDIIQLAPYEDWPHNRMVTGIATSSALLLTFLLHVVISIVGASFTCGAVCDCNTHNSSRRRYVRLTVCDCNTNNSSRRRYQDYNNEYRQMQGQDPRNNLTPTTPLLPQPNAPPVNEASQPPSYGAL